MTLVTITEGPLRVGDAVTVAVVPASVCWCWPSRPATRTRRPSTVLSGSGAWSDRERLLV